jgi:hypothetical protein
LFVGKDHKLYQFFKESYANRKSGEGGKLFKNFKHAIDLETSLSSGIAGKCWYDEYVVLEGETFRSPIPYVTCPDLTNNRVLSVQFHDPVYDSEFVFQSKILEGAKYEKS